MTLVTCARSTTAPTQKRSTAPAMLDAEERDKKNRELPTEEGSGEKTEMESCLLRVILFSFVSASSAARPQGRNRWAKAVRVKIRPDSKVQHAPRLPTSNPFRTIRKNRKTASPPKYDASVQLVCQASMLNFGMYGCVDV